MISAMCTCRCVFLSGSKSSVVWWLIFAFRIIVFSGRKGVKAPRENQPNGVFSPRHTKERDIPCVAVSATVCRIFAWRGERSPWENTKKSPFGGFSRGVLYDKSATILSVKTRIRTRLLFHSWTFYIILFICFI